MERETLLQALHATTVATDQKQAGAYLDQLSKSPGFAPELLKISCDTTVAEIIRQAAVIYFKNTLAKFWEVDELDTEHAKEFGTFQLLDTDKQLIKDNILQAICVTADTTRSQLCTAAQQIIRTEYPDKWPLLVPTLQQQLVSPDGAILQGALLLIYRLAKVYEYKRAKERQPLTNAMVVLLPIMLDRMQQLMPNQSQEAVTIQLLTLKVVYSLVQFALNLKMLSIADMDQWLEICRLVMARPLPDEIKELDDKEQMQHLVWWKSKKWAGKILSRTFERYGAPGQVDHDYSEFATHFLQVFSVPCAEVMLGILNNYQQKEFVTDRVLHLALTFLNTSVAHSHVWRIIKPHALDIIKTVMFPLMCHSDDDEELWEDDVEEYVRFKYDIFEGMHNPADECGSLLVAFSKRKEIMPSVLQFTIEVLNNSKEPRHIDGALRMIGDLSSQLIKSKKWKKDVEKLLDTHIVGRLKDPARFVRARAAWCVRQYSETPFHSTKILRKLIDSVIDRVVDSNEELPVVVESALAIQMLLNDQRDKAHDMVQPHVHNLIPRVLEMVAKTQIEDIIAVMDELVEQFIDDVIPIAADIAERLSSLFLSIVSSEVADDRTPALMSILNTLASILGVVEEHREIMVRMEASVLRVIDNILVTCNAEFFDEMLNLVESLITTNVSEPMWTVFNNIYVVFKSENCRDTMISFTDIMPVLHLFVVTDTESFLARPERLAAILDICQIVLSDNEQGDENQLYAAKLLEVLILQCNGFINEAIPTIMMLALQRLSLPFEDGLTELKPLLILVVVAVAYTNTAFALQVLKQVAPDHPNPLDYLSDELFKLSKEFEGVHNRKMALLGWCILLRLGADTRPSIVNYEPKRVIETCLTIFDGLQRALKVQAETKSVWDGDSDEESDDDDVDQIKNNSKKTHRKMDDDLSDNEDEIDESTLEYLESLKKSSKKNASGDSDNESDDEDDDSTDFEEVTDTEQFPTPMDHENAVDVFIHFRQTFDYFEKAEPLLYQQMVGSLSPEQVESLKALITVCDQHIKSDQSQKLEQAGGYSFNAAATVPSNFHFG